MKRESFVLSAIILTLGGFFAKAIGALYKIPLTNILGSSGMGVYYLIFPIYSLVITFCSSGICVALSTEVAKCRKIRHRYNEQKLLRIALYLSFIMSLIFAVVIIILSRLIAEAQGNVNAVTGYIAIAPAIILSSLIATIRGYFQGIENMVPTTVSMIIEQIVKLSVGLVLAHKLCIYGIEYAVLGAILGVTISEVVALIIIVINFISYKGQLYYNYRNLNYKRKKHLKIKPIVKAKKKYIKSEISPKNHTFICNSKNIRYSNKVAFLKLLKVALPCTFSSILVPIATMLDSFMIINFLNKSGYSLVLSTSLYGMWGGVVQSLISLPIIVVSAISTSLVPSLSGLIVKNDTNEIKNKTSFYIKLTWILSIGMFIIFYVFAEDILRFLYGNGLSDGVIDELYYATKMLKLSSVSIIYYSFLQTFTAILQTIGKSHIPFFALLFGLILRTGLMVLLVLNPSINIFGAIVANIVFLSVVDIIMAYVIKGKIDLDYKFYPHLLKPMIIGFSVLIICEIAHYVLKSIVNYLVSAVFIAVIGVVLYILLIAFGKVFTRKELCVFKKKKKVLPTDKVQTSNNFK